MFYQVFKSLDNPSSFMGLKGSYLRYAAVGIAIALVISFAIGSVTNGLLGIIIFVALGALDYMGVMAFQARFSERERKKWFASRKLPDVLVLDPIQFRRLVEANLEKAKRIKQKNSS